MFVAQRRIGEADRAAGQPAEQCEAIDRVAKCGGKFGAHAHQFQLRNDRSKEPNGGLARIFDIDIAANLEGISVRSHVVIGRMHAAVAVDGSPIQRGEASQRLAPAQAKGGLHSYSHITIDLV